MWRRADLKQDAKTHLSGRYWSAFAVALVMSLLGGGSVGSTGTTSSYRMNSNDISWREWMVPGQAWDNITDFLNNLNWPAIMLFSGIAVFAALFAIAFKIFVGNVIEAGGDRWYSRNREMANTPSIGFMFSLFRSGNYLATVSAQFWRGLMLFLWSLLPLVFSIGAGVSLFVPVFRITSVTGDQAGMNWLNSIGPILILIYVVGVMLLSLVYTNRIYAYRMVPWILGDNPTIGRKRALRLSIEMTKGHKWSMFVLDLSFIGWFILGFLACCVGILFVLPYYNATQAELYARLRTLAVEKNMSSMEEFGYIRAPEYQQ